MYAAYQCVEIVGEYLVGASAHKLQTFNLCNGSQISSWTCPDQLNKTALASQSEPTNNEDALQGSGAPSIEVAGSDSNQRAKRRKLSDPVNKESPSVPKTPKGESPRTCSQRTAANSSTHPNIVALTSSNDGKYVVIVTGEDKTIRVLQHDDGHLQQISERSMPKRPCAVTLSPSGSTIICADKFGDVYSLPLLVDLPGRQDATTTPLVEDENLSEKPKQFVSSANDLTVHSARNRRALQNQLKQNLAKADKAEANFGQQLLLGHVSMLTDISLVEECGRNYIITADRDEHIRVSRGIPQSHIIEAYCLGHSEFVSRLCLPKSARRLLISGGGDDDLFVWDWLLGDLLQKVNIASHAEEFKLRGSSGEGRGVGIGANDDSHSPKILVSGIKHLLHGPNCDSGSVVVTCEGVPALFFFALSPTGILSHCQTLPLNGNPLAVATNKQNNALVVSVDLLHSPGSVAQLRGVETTVAEEPLKVVKFEGKDWNALTSHFGKVDITGANHQTMPVANVDWWNVLYNLGNLRKRAG
ncbi:tRNA (guanine-N(7)-)-methyltransferase non-catalytic subunit trm82 [Pseudogymnoascus australis]